MTKKGPLSKSEKQYIEDNQGLAADEIAEELDRSEKSVSKHLAKLAEQQALDESDKKEPAVSAAITGTKKDDSDEEPALPKAGELMARNDRYGAVTMTEQASAAGDISKPDRLAEKVNIAPRHRGSIHKIKGD